MKPWTLISFLSAFLVMVQSLLCPLSSCSSAHAPQVSLQKCGKIRRHDKSTKIMWNLIITQFFNCSLSANWLAIKMLWNNIYSSIIYSLVLNFDLARTAASDIKFNINKKLDQLKVPSTHHKKKLLKNVLAGI